MLYSELRTCVGGPIHSRYHRSLYLLERDSVWVIGREWLRRKREKNNNNCVQVVREIFTYLQTSVTRWLDHFFNFWPFETMEICPIVTFAKIDSMFCQILTKHSNYWQIISNILPKWQHFDKSGHTANT